MGLLENLWDDILAGPKPEKGLKKLRRYDSGPLPSSQHVPISRSITILKSNCSNNRVSSADSSSSGPSSPAGSSAPSSPLSPWTPRRDTKKLMRMKSTSAALEEPAEPRSPTVYDWVVISAIDR